MTAVAARRFGERRSDEASRIAGDALLLSLALGTVVAVGLMYELPRMFALMQTPPDVTALGSAYLRTFLFGTPLIYGFFAIDAAFRASGDTRTPFILLLASVAVTLVLDPVLILGIGPFPKLGIAGAAIATIGTRGAAFLMGVWIAARRASFDWAASSSRRSGPCVVSACRPRSRESRSA